MTITATDQRKAQAIFSLFNLGCVSCSSIVEDKLKKVHGIKRASVDYVTETVQVDFDPQLLTADTIRAFLTKLGQRGKRR
jgi:Cu+-exporting ATPase